MQLDERFREIADLLTRAVGDFLQEGDLPGGGLGAASNQRQGAAQGLHLHVGVDEAATDLEGTERRGEHAELTLQQASGLVSHRQLAGDLGQLGVEFLQPDLSAGKRAVEVLTRDAGGRRELDERFVDVRDLGADRRFGSNTRGREGVREGLLHLRGHRHVRLRAALDQRLFGSGGFGEGLLLSGELLLGSGLHLEAGRLLDLVQALKLGALFSGGFLASFGGGVGRGDCAIGRLDDDLSFVAGGGFEALASLNLKLVQPVELGDFLLGILIRSHRALGLDARAFHRRGDALLRGGEIGGFDADRVHLDLGLLVGAVGLGYRGREALGRGGGFLVCGFRLGRGFRGVALYLQLGALLRFQFYEAVGGLFDPFANIAELVSVLLGRQGPGLVLSPHRRLFNGVLAKSALQLLDTVASAAVGRLGLPSDSLVLLQLDAELIDLRGGGCGLGGQVVELGGGGAEGLNKLRLLGDLLEFLREALELGRGISAFLRERREVFCEGGDALRAGRLDGQFELDVVDIRGHSVPCC